MDRHPECWRQREEDAHQALVLVDVLDVKRPLLVVPSAGSGLWVVQVTEWLVLEGWARSARNTASARLNGQSPVRSS